jgi:SAM-dependent methyltransferase
MIDEALVRACYQGVLGRPPESERVIQEKIAGIATLEGLIGELIAAPEFQTRTPTRVAEDYFRPPRPIAVHVPPAQLTALFERLRRQWRALGESEPFWSVLTHDEFRAANLDGAAVARFYETGAEHAALIELFCARNSVEIRRGTCIELGCGVGRVTRHLAARFERVIAIDIAEGNLDECRKMAEAAGLANIDCVLLQSPEALKRVDAADFFYSVIALQHSQPPVQKYMLEVLLSKLRPGGGFLFQTQTDAPGYGFDVADHLAAPLETMDMHCLPMCEILRLIEARGHGVREVIQDIWTGRFGSHTFFGQARPRRRLFGRG